MFNPSVITEMRNRRLDVELQNDLDDIETKIRIFRKNHKQKKQMVRKDLHRMVESGRRMCLGDLEEFDRRKNMKLTADICNLENDEDRKSTRCDSRTSFRRNSDESCRLPNLFGEMKSNDEVPLSQPISLPLIDSRPTTPVLPTLPTGSKWRMLAKVILPVDPEPQKTEPTEKPKTVRRSSDPRISESENELVPEYSDHPPISGRITSVNREMEPMREEDTESCCVRSTQFDTETTQFSRRNSIVTSNMDIKPNADFGHNKKRFSISVSELPLLNRRTSVCPSEANSKLSFQPTVYNKFNRRASCSFSRVGTSFELGSEKDTMENRWRRLKSIASNKRERKEDSSCRKLASMTVDVVVRSFITSLQETSQKAKEKKAVEDLYYLRKCRYLRHPTCLY